MRTYGEHRVKVVGDERAATRLATTLGSLQEQDIQAEDPRARSIRVKLRLRGLREPTGPQLDAALWIVTARSPG
jgi:hypothetical protein